MIRGERVQKLCDVISKIIVEDLENNFQAQLIRFQLVGDKIFLQRFKLIQSKLSTISDISKKGSPVIIEIHHHISLSDKHFFK